MTGRRGAGTGVRHGSEAEQQRPPHLQDRADEFAASGFDRFASAASDFASRAIFFAGCVLLVLLWAPSIALIRKVDTWQLIINTATTIVTFLMVALLQNSQRRSEQAIHGKLDALARGVEDVLEQFADRDPGQVDEDIEALRTAVGLDRRA